MKKKTGNGRGPESALHQQRARVITKFAEVRSQMDPRPLLLCSTFSGVVATPKGALVLGLAA